MCSVGRCLSAPGPGRGSLRFCEALLRVEAKEIEVLLFLEMWKNLLVRLERVTCEKRVAWKHELPSTRDKDEIARVNLRVSHVIDGGFHL